MKTKIIVSIAVLLLITVFVSCGKNPMYSVFTAVTPTASGGGVTVVYVQTAKWACDISNPEALKQSSDVRLIDVSPQSSNIIKDDGTVDTWEVIYTSKNLSKKYHYYVTSAADINLYYQEDYTTTKDWWFSVDWSKNSPNWVKDISAAAGMTTTGSIILTGGSININGVFSYYVTADNGKKFKLQLLPFYQISARDF